MSLRINSIDLILESQEFVIGMEVGMGCYFAERLHTPFLTEKDILAVLYDAMIEDSDGGSETYRAGFVFGWLCGLLHPDLADRDTHSPWVKVLAAKYSKQQNRKLGKAISSRGLLRQLFLVLSRIPITTKQRSSARH